MIPSIISVLVAAHALVESHPVEAKWLLAKAKDLFAAVESHDADVGVIAAMKRREMQAGIAAAVASAITTAQERAKRMRQGNQP